MLSYKPARPRDVTSLQNWVNRNACLARNETEYLTHCKELISVVSPDAGTSSQLESWIEDTLVRFYRIFSKASFHPLTTIVAMLSEYRRAVPKSLRESHTCTFFTNL